MKVTYLPMNITVEGKKGQNLLDLAHDNGIDIEHACGGNCACSTCHVIVKQGMKSLSEQEDDEFDILDRASDVTLTSRLSCQTIIEGDEDVIVVVVE